MMEVLLEEHRAMFAVADEILAKVSMKTIDFAELGRLRTRMAQRMRQHLATEERLVFAPLKAIGGEARVPALAALCAEIRDIRLAYSQHVRIWHGQAIAADPVGYRSALGLLIRRVKWLAQREEAEIYAPVARLLAEAQAIRVAA
jgi:hypothetical protein